MAASGWFRMSSTVSLSLRPLTSLGQTIFSLPGCGPTVFGGNMGMLLFPLVLARLGFKIARLVLTGGLGRNRGNRDEDGDCCQSKSA